MILLCYGTRPEWIKIKPLIEEFKKNNIEYLTLFTGQHSTLIGEHNPDYAIDIEDTLHVNRLDCVVKSIMGVFTKILLNPQSISYVMVQGDTTTAMAIALSAFHNGVKVIHLEAGLRTYDRENPYPEEINRRIISQIADIHLCPTFEAENNLHYEGLSGKFFVVGNTVIDNLLPYKNKCEYTNKILITLHRRENHHWMEEWFKWIDYLAYAYQQYEFILPMHPNPNVQKHRNILTHVNVVEPLPYEKMLDLLVKTRLVITDSGGLQEECSFFNKKCLVCRKVTERPEAIGQSSFMIDNPVELVEIFVQHHNNFEINYECPFGDGHSAEKITQILKTII